MAAPKLRYGIGNAASTTLSSSVTNTDTSFPLTATTNFQAKSGAGEVLIDEGAASEELGYATGLGGSSLTIPLANRGLEGGSAQAHSSQVSIKGVLSVGMWNDLVDSLLNWFDQTAGTVKPNLGSDATGDIYYRNSGGALARLGVGSNSQVLQLSSGLPSWQTISSNADGWTASGDTWTYASASTFTIAGVDRTTTFTKGTRLKFTQTTAKYAVVVSSAFSTDTTVTIAVNTDYTIANAAITSPQYSYQLSPAGYPNWFTFAPTFGGFTATVPNAGMGMKYRIEGNTCYFKMHYTSDGTSNATTFTITIPVAAAHTLYNIGVGFAKDNGSNVTPTFGHIETTATSATVSLWKTLYQGAWTNVNAKNFWLDLPAVVEF